MSNPIQANVDSIRSRIARAAERAGRKPGEITLVAASKTFGPDQVLAAYQAGIRDVGENRVEEALDKIPPVFAALPSAPPLRWHMIGHVQRRKAREVAQNFDLVQSVDSVRLAEALHRAAARPLPILLEINIASEPQKFGLLPEPRDELCRQVEALLALGRLQIHGLMTVGPQTDKPSDSAPYFRQLRQIRDDLRLVFPALDWAELSMGMTADFEIAIAEGATMVRIGRAIFGERS